MPQFLHKLIIINIYLLSFVFQAQVLKDELANVQRNIDFGYLEKENIDKAFSLLDSNKQKQAYTIAHQLLNKNLDVRSKTNTNLLLAYYFNSMQLVDSSMYYSNRVLKYSKLIKNDSLKNRFHCVTYNLFAINNKIKGLLQESKKWNLKGIDLSKKLKDKDLYYKHIHGLAGTYTSIGDYKNALKLYEECLNNLENPEIIFGSYINIGNIYGLLKNYDSSNAYYQKALKLGEKNKNYYAIATIKTNLAVNYQEQNNIDKAFSLFNESLKLSQEKEYNDLTTNIRLNIGLIYIGLKQYKDAEIMFSSGLDTAIKLGYLNKQKIIYDNLKDIFIAKNNYKKAFLFAKKSFKIEDSISKLQKDKEINELEVKYKTLQKEKEITLLQKENYSRKLKLKNQTEVIRNLELEQEIEKKENENKTLSFKNASEKKLNEIILLKKDQEAKLIREKSIKNTIFYSFLILLIPIIGLLIIYYQKLQAQSELNKTQEEINKQKISSLIKDQELKVIKASIKSKDKERKRIAQELHDSIGGNLAAIKLKLNNSINNDSVSSLRTINNQIDDTYEQVRTLSHNLISKKFSDNNFCNVLEEYINSIWGANSSFILHPRKEIDLLNENLQVEIFKIIQELTTNTIKHAKATSIDLQINLIEDELNILFEDNGIGFIPKHNKEGIGFRNIQNRLKQFHGTFHIDSRITRGTIINIEIPTLTKI